MSVPIISEVCYTCSSCTVSKQICKLKNIPIQNIYKDKCDDYSQREMERCVICGAYIIELAQHVKHQHKKTMSEYKIISRDAEKIKTSLRRNSLWE